MAINIKDGLVTKVGPLPAWAWGVVGGGAIAGFVWWRRRNANSTAVATGTEDFASQSQYVGWGSAPYTSGVYSDGGIGGSIDMSPITDAITQMRYDALDDAAAMREAFYQSQLDARDNANTLNDLLAQQRATARDDQIEFMQQQREAAAQAAQAAQAATAEQTAAIRDAFASQAVAPPPPAAPALAAPPPTPPKPAPPKPAPAKPASGTIVWHGVNKPNMDTLRKANPGVALVLVDNSKGHAKNSPSRYVVKVS